MKAMEAATVAATTRCVWSTFPGRSPGRPGPGARDVSGSDPA